MFMNFLAKPVVTPDGKAETGIRPNDFGLSLWQACKVPALFSIIMLAVVVSLTGDLRAVFVVIGLFVMSSLANFFAGKIKIL
jgi:hypothetical protein